MYSIYFFCDLHLPQRTFGKNQKYIKKRNNSLSLNIVYHFSIMSVFSELAECLECDLLKESKPTISESQKELSRRVATPQSSAPRGEGHNSSSSHDKLVTSQIFDLPAIDPKISQLKPWKTDAKYFNKCMIGSLALMKMTTHAQSGGSIEIMGMLVGKIVNRTIVVMDTYRLPVEGTETRVNAQGEAYEYMVQYLELNQKISSDNKRRQENIVGWYHSHPGYGCWLSGIDVSTQELNQNFQDPYLAIVVDPVKTLKLGKVDIGAFRTLPAGVTEGGGGGGNGGTNDGATKRAALLNLPKSKRQEFGSHSGRYYSLDVEIFENEYDGEMLRLMRKKQDSLDYEGWMKKLSVDKTDSVKAVYEDAGLSSLLYLDNFEFVEDKETSQLREIIKKLESLKFAPGENSTSLLLKKIIGASNSEVAAPRSRGVSRRRQVEFEEEDVFDESDLERVDTGEDKLEGETEEGEDWDDDEDDESGNEHDIGEQGVSEAIQEKEKRAKAKTTAAKKICDDASLEQSSSSSTPPSTSAVAVNTLPSRIKRSIRKQLRSRKDDLSDLLYDPALAEGSPHKLKRKQRSLVRHPHSDDYLRQIEFLELQRRQQRWARERAPGGGGGVVGVVGVGGVSAVGGGGYGGPEYARYSMSTSMTMNMREKNKLVIEASRAVAAKNICDLITMEAEEKIKNGGRSNE